MSLKCTTPSIQRCSSCCLVTASDTSHGCSLLQDALLKSLVAGTRVDAEQTQILENRSTATPLLKEIKMETEPMMVVVVVVVVGLGWGGEDTQG